MAVKDLLQNLGQRLTGGTYQQFVLIFILVATFYIVVNEVVRYQARIPTLKGPSGLPLIGNLHQIRTNAAEQYRKWAKSFGAVYQIQLGNIPIVVVNSAAAARVIFGQNSNALSSRPEFYTFHKVLSTTAGTTIGTSPYSDSLKRRRKGAASALNRPSVQTYVSHLDTETRAFCKEILDYGKGGKVAVDPLPMIQRLSLSLALTLNWGIRLDSQEDELFKEITHVEDVVSGFRSTTGNLQDYIPILRLNLFSFGSSSAREMRTRRDVYLNKLNDDLDKRIAEGTHKPCIQAHVILDKENQLNKEELTSISLTMLSGGLDTISAVVSWSIALLSQRPDIQDAAKRAIAELYGDDTPLCNPEDDQKCPYIVALVRECLRYYTVLRLALPRASIKDIVYDNTIIPKETVIFLNSWACNMDSDVWEDPEIFRPERWLENPNAPMFTYGLGYRMCAGSLLANRELYLLFMRVINSFRIEKSDDVDFHPISGNSDPRTLVSVPHTYRSIFIPHNEAVLRQSLKNFIITE